MDDLKIYRLMHKFGKLASCNSEKPNTADKMFVEELKELMKNEI